MWAVYKSNGTERLWYVGSNGCWSNDSSRAARWVDRRDAFQAIHSNDYIGRAQTGWLEDGRKADPHQTAPGRS